MKTSNLLLGLWILLIAGIVFTVTFLLVRPDEPDAAGRGDGVVPVAADPSTRKPPTPPVPRDRAVRQPRRAAQVTIAGTVERSGGEPAAGAEVLLTSSVRTASPVRAELTQEHREMISQLVYLDVEDWDAPRPLHAFSEPVAQEAAAAEEPEEIARTTVAEDGSFEFQLSPMGGAGPFRVVARHAEWGTASASRVRAGEEVHLTLGHAGVVTGQVLTDIESRAVPGATVVFEDGATFSALTDDEGRFRIEGMTPGHYFVTAGAKDLTPLIGKRVQVTRLDPVELRLPQGATMTVSTVVIDFDALAEEAEAEPPVPGAEIVAVEEDTFAYVVGRTGADGRVVFAGLPPGKYVVNGRAPGVISTGEVLTEIRPGQLALDVEVEFEPAVEQVVEVVDLEGRPVSGMVFYTGNVDEEYDSLRSVKLPGQTDASGRYPFAFEFEGARAAIYGFKPGYAMVRAYPDDYAPLESDVLRLVAKRPLKVRGTVRTESGVPVPGATVMIEYTLDGDGEATAWDDVLLRVETDVEGRYAFEFLPPADEIVLYAETDDAASDDAFLEPEPGKTEYEQDLVLDLEVDFSVPTLDDRGSDE